jgi:hypothetical protein
MTASNGELHTASGEWLSNVFLALAQFTRLKQDGCYSSNIFPKKAFHYSLG